MIKSFKCKETEKVWNEDFSKKIPHDIQKRALQKLRMINIAEALEDLKVPPNNHLEALKGNRQGQHSIRINDQFRICFKWLDNHAFNLEIVDYH
jgi:toxin HigB-1